jgi:hypothetical protein
MDLNCNVYWCKYLVALNPGLCGMGSNMHHDKAQSNQACNIFIFVVFGGFQSSLFIYFNKRQYIAPIVLFCRCESTPVKFEEKSEALKWYKYIIVCFKSFYHSRLNAAL